MRVSYTPEQKARAVEVYNETKSYAKTIRILGYPPQYRTARCRQRDNELRPRFGTPHGKRPCADEVAAYLMTS